MRSLLLLEAINRRIIAKRMKRRNRKRNLKKKYGADWLSLPSLLLNAITRRVIAKQRRSRQRKRKLEEIKSADWSSLPSDILWMVASKLTFADCLSISKVCRAWNTVLGEEHTSWQRHGFPWLLVSGQKNNYTRTCISLLDNRIWEFELSEAYGKYCWGSFHDWLIMAKDIDSFHLELSLLNPFSRSQVHLPSTWNFYHKMVLSEVPLENNFVCMLLHSQERELAFWVPGAKSWHKHKLTGAPFEDAVICDGSFYLLGDGFNLWQIDLKSIYSAINEGDDNLEIQFHEVEKPPIFQLQEGAMLHGNDDCQILRYLVESCGEILLVCRYFSPKQDLVLETQKFEVYAFDSCLSSWEKVQDLRNEMIFLGKCSSISFSAKELGVGIRNSIYFSNDQRAPWWNEWDSNHLKGISTRLGFNKYDGRDWGVFSLDHEDGGEPFCFHGNIDNWGYTWFTAPSWWCYRNVPVMEWS